MRQIPAKILSFSQLNLPEALKKLCHLDQGLVVVTGPTGSGKSTTLAAMIDYINDNFARHIITIEDPIEFVHPCKKSTIVHARSASTSRQQQQRWTSCTGGRTDRILDGDDVPAKLSLM